MAAQDLLPSMQEMLDLKATREPTMEVKKVGQELWRSMPVQIPSLLEEVAAASITSAPSLP